MCRSAVVRFVVIIYIGKGKLNCFLNECVPRFSDV